MITESAIIFAYLCDLYPQAGMAPPVGSPARARFAAWLGLYVSVLEPVITAKFRGPDGVTDAQAAAYETLCSTWTGALGRGDYLTGDAFSAADILFGSLLIFFRSSMPADQIYDDWVARISARPALARAQAKDARPA